MAKHEMDGPFRYVLLRLFTGGYFWIYGCINCSARQKLGSSLIWISILYGFNIDLVRSNGTVQTENAAMRSDLRGLAPRAAEDLVALLRGWVL